MTQPKTAYIIVAFIVCLLLLSGASLVYAAPFVRLDYYGASVAVVGDDPWYGDHYVTLIDGAQSLGAEDDVNATVSINASELGHDEMAFLVLRFADPVVLNTESEYTIDYAGRCGRGGGYCMSGLITDAVAFEGPAIAYGGGDPYHQHLAPTYAGTVVYGVFLGFSVYATEVSTFTVDYAHLSGDAYVYPTATPTPVVTATPGGSIFVMPCITGTVRTATPAVAYTLTPRGNLTPHPTATGPTPTKTPDGFSARSSYDSGVLSFDSNVNALSAVGEVNQSGSGAFVQWASVAGQDGRPGAAYMHSGIGDVLTSTADYRMVAVYKTADTDYYGPVAVTFYAKAAYTVTAGNTQSVRVWYYDPDYYGAGDGVWVTADTGWPSDYVAYNSWTKYGAVVSAVGGSGRIAAIGFSDERWPTAGANPDCGEFGCVYLDDIHIAYGDDAGNVLQYCTGTGTGTGTGSGGSGVAQRPCVVDFVDVDVRAVCVRPTGLDLGGWLSYLWCNIWRFFGPVDENRRQVDAIAERQALNEPFGSISEVGDVAADFEAVVSDLNSQNKYQAQNPIDWLRLMSDGAAFDEMIQFSVPELSSEYWDECPAAVLNFSQRAAGGACMALYLARESIIVVFLQWGLNAVFVVGVIMLVKNDLSKLSE